MEIGLELRCEDWMRRASDTYGQSILYHLKLMKVGCRRLMCHVVQNLSSWVWTEFSVYIDVWVYHDGLIFPSRIVHYVHICDAIMQHILSAKYEQNIAISALQLYVWMHFKVDLHVAHVFRIVCKRACSCLIPSATTSGSQTRPSFSSSTRKTCLSRKFKHLRWQYVSRSTEVFIRN